MIFAIVVFMVLSAAGAGFFCGKLHERFEWNRLLEDGTLRPRDD